MRSTAERGLSFSQLFAVTNNTTINILAHLFCYTYVRISRVLYLCGIAGSYCMSVSKCSRNGNCPKGWYHRKCPSVVLMTFVDRVPGVLHPYQPLGLSIFFISACGLCIVKVEIIRTSLTR